MTWDGEDFAGAKIALMCDNHIITYLRDDIDTIPYPGQWDLPGGGREGNESPIDCALRETEEEFGLRISPSRVRQLRKYSGVKSPGFVSYFCLCDVTNDEIESIVFGDEGQYWELMPINVFLEHENAIEHLKDRLIAALAADRLL